MFKPAATIHRHWLIPIISLIGITLTHGVALGCIIYCVLIHPPMALLDHAGHHAHRVQQHTAVDTMVTWHAPEPWVLSAGSDTQSAVAPTLDRGMLTTLRQRRWVADQHHVGWCPPPDHPPPRLFLAIT